MRALLAGLLIPAAAAVVVGRQAAPAAADKTRLDVRHVHIWVADVDRTKAFYRDVLGLTVSEERAGETVEFENGKLWFGKTRSSAPLATNAITIGLEAPSVQAVYDRLKARGVSVPPPEERRYGWSFHLKDPDGYEIEIEGAR
jgi:predicted enzyme related to lactoylglutathione lyase